MKGKQQDIHELTRIEAFLLSEKAGHPSHMHDYFWSQAEAIVRQRAAIVEVAVKAAGRKSVKEKSAPAKPAASKTKKTPAPVADVAPAPAKPELAKKAPPKAARKSTLPAARKKIRKSK